MSKGVWGELGREKINVERGCEVWFSEISKVTLGGQEFR